jgi:phage gp36-like protein
MPYATPLVFIQRYGAEESAQVLADGMGVLTPELLVAAISGVWPAGITADEQAVASAAVARMVHELAITSNYMDGYLRSACTLPLAATDANTGMLEVCCLRLTRSALASDGTGATERTDSQAQEQRAWLRDVAQGRVQLVSNSGDAVAPNRNVKTGQAASGFSWGGFPFGGGYQ